MRRHAAQLTTPPLRLLLRAGWLLPAMLCMPLPALAADPAGMLTVFVGLPILVAAVVVLGVLALFRRHAWVRRLGTLVGACVLLIGVYVACVDTWRFWPDRGAADAPTQVAIVIGYGLLWLCLVVLTSAVWRGTSRVAGDGIRAPTRYP